MDTLGATNEPMINDRNELLASQVHAFLEASEDVDVDADTIEDILQTLMVDKEDVEDAKTRVDAQMNEDDDSDGELEASTQELDISPLFERNHEGFSPFPCYYFPLIYVSQRRGHGLSKRSSKCSTSSRSVVSLFLTSHHGSCSDVCYRVFRFYRRIRADASNSDTKIIARLWGRPGIPLRTITRHALLMASQCPELQDRRPATMAYFLRVAMSHQWANISNSRTTLTIYLYIW